MLTIYLHRASPPVEVLLHDCAVRSHFADGFEIARLFLLALSASDTQLSPDAYYLNILVTLAMPPFQHLHRLAFDLIELNDPLATADLDMYLIRWEMKIRQKDFGAKLLRTGSISGQTEIKGSILEVKAVLDHGTNS